MTSTKAGENMDKQTLIAELGISDRSWRRWCAALSIPSNQKTYSDEEIGCLTELRQRLADKEGFDSAIAAITGNPPPSQSGNNFVSAIKKGVGKQLNRQADDVGLALAEAFQEQVYDSFLKHLARGRFDRFEELIESTTFALDSAEPLEAYLLEASEDE